MTIKYTKTDISLSWLSSSSAITMPRQREPERLETLSVRALVAFILSDLGDHLTIDLLTLKPKPNTYFSSAVDSDDDADDIDDDHSDGNNTDEDDDKDRPPPSRKTSKSKLPPTSATVQLQRCCRFLHTYFDYNIPAPAHDAVCVEFFARFPAAIGRIKKTGMSRSSMAHYRQKVNVIITLAECVVSGRLTRLDFERMPKMLRHVFYRRMDCMHGLRWLNLSSMSGGWRTEDMEPTVLAGIVAMPQLEYFCLNYDCTDAILLALAEHCPRLHTLDVSSSKWVTNESVHLVGRFAALREVQLYRTSVTMEGYINLLLHQSQLHDIGRYDEIGRVLEYIMQYHPDRAPFGLRKFASRYVTTTHLELLAENCPDVRHVSIFHNVLLCDLMQLVGCDALADLRLMSCDFFADRVRDVLHVKGCNLTRLHLEHVDEIDMNALMYISQFCADLEELVFYNCEMVESTSMGIKRPTVPPFMNLKRLTLIAQCDGRHVDFLLAGCLRLEYVRLGSMVPTTDGLMAELMERNGFQWLKEMRVVSSDELTVATAYRLVELCGRLEVLTEVDGWRGSEADEWEAFRVWLRVNNVGVCAVGSRAFGE